MPFQPSLRHLCNMVQVYEDDYSQVIASYSLKEKSDIDRLKMRAVCASNWLKKYAPDDMRFTVKKEVTIKLEGKEKEAVKNLVSYMESKSELDEKLLYEEIYNISRAAGVEPKDFFKVCYQILIGKEKGPKLAGFILIIGKDRVLDLLKQAI